MKLYKKLAYNTHWVAVDETKEYPHGWGFEPPIVSLKRSDYVDSLSQREILELIKSKLDNDEFVISYVVPRGMWIFDCETK